MSHGDNLDSGGSEFPWLADFNLPKSRFIAKLLSVMLWPIIGSGSRAADESLEAVADMRSAAGANNRSSTILKRLCIA